MRFLLGLILTLHVGAAQAHVSPVPFPDVGSLQDAHKAAFSIVQTYLPPTVPQIFYNIVIDAGAACNGDVQTVTRIASIASGTKNLSVTVNTFSGGDVGKVITIPGAGGSGGNYSGTIATFTDAQHVVLNNNAQTTLSAVSTAITYGTNDAPAFDTFNNWARANQGASNQVVLTIPNGSSCWFGNGTFNYISVFNAWAAGINNLIVEGTGATINSVGGFSFQLGSAGVCPYGLTSANGCSARLQTANAGDATVTLTAASLSAGYISRFTVGQWIMLGTLDTQGEFQNASGYPPNQTTFEWRKITNVNAGTGVITLDRPITNTYLSALPNYNSGNNNQSDNGGPATIWTVGNSGIGGTQNAWNTTLEYRGLTISQEGQTYANGRNITYRNVTFTGGNGGIPTQNETWSAINASFAGVNMETDKLVGTMLMDGVTISQIINQSTSTDRFIMRNSTVTLRLDGGARYTEITDSTLSNFGPGTYAYGNTGEANQTICTRCNITTLNYIFNNGYNTGSETYYTKSGGIITMPNAAAQGPGPGQRYFVPGSRILYTAGTTNPPTNPFFACCESIGSFQVVSMTADPWPALDNQIVSAAVTSSIGSNVVQVAGSSFSSGDIGKTIIIPGSGPGGGTADFRTYITNVSGAGPQNLTLYNTASKAQSGVTQTLQWGTSNTYIQTNQSGGFPDPSAFSSSVPGIGFKVVGSWNFTCDACTGDANAVGTSIQAGATPSKPLGSYVSRTFTPSSAQGNLDVVPGRGTFKSLRINVTTAATSGGAVTLSPGGQFHWYLIDQNNPLAPIIFDWLSSNLIINLKQAGDRVITPSGVTCNGSAGACAGDTITRPTNLATMWVQMSVSITGPPRRDGAIQPYMGQAYTTAPTFTIELQTDPIQ